MRRKVFARSEPPTTFSNEEFILLKRFYLSFVTAFSYTFVSKSGGGLSSALQLMSLRSISCGLT